MPCTWVCLNWLAIVCGGRGACDVARRNQRQRDRQIKRRRNRRSERRTPNTPAQPPQQNMVDMASDNGEIRRENKHTILVQAIRAVAFLPIVVPMTIFALPSMLSDSIPTYFQSILDEHVQLPILTMTAGNAGIMGIFLQRGSRATWATFALSCAALATYIAGHSALDLDKLNSNAAYAIITAQLFSVVAIIMANSISRMTISLTKTIWSVLYSKSTLYLVGVLIIVLTVSYNQSQNENYISDWLLIPFGTVFGLILASLGLWGFIRLLGFTYRHVKIPVFNLRLRFKKFIRKKPVD